MWQQCGLARIRKIGMLTVPGSAPRSLRLRTLSSRRFRLTQNTSPTSPAINMSATAAPTTDPMITALLRLEPAQRTQLVSGQRSHACKHTVATFHTAGTAMLCPDRVC